MFSDHSKPNSDIPPKTLRPQSHTKGGAKTPLTIDPHHQDLEGCSILAIMTIPRIDRPCSSEVRAGAKTALNWLRWISVLYFFTLLLLALTISVLGQDPNPAKKLPTTYFWYMFPFAALIPWLLSASLYKFGQYQWSLRFSCAAIGLGLLNLLGGVVLVVWQSLAL